VRLTISIVARAIIAKGKKCFFMSDDSNKLHQRNRRNHKA
jgi:hypothetical protein